MTATHTHKTRKRHFKIQRKVYMDRSYFQRAILPEIKLSDKWLKEAGFNNSESVIIIYEKNKLVIVKDEKPGFLF